MNNCDFTQHLQPIKEFCLHAKNSRTTHAMLTLIEADCLSPVEAWKGPEVTQSMMSVLQIGRLVSTISNDNRLDVQALVQQ